MCLTTRRACWKVASGMKLHRCRPTLPTRIMAARLRHPTNRERKRLQKVLVGACMTVKTTKYRKGLGVLQL